MTAISTQRVNWPTSLFQSMKSLGERVTTLQRTLGVNNQNIPLSYVDATSLLENDLSDDNTSLTYAIDFSEGYATTNGLPFWDRLENERVEFYNLFKHYRNLKDTSESRSLVTVAEQTGNTISVIHILAQCYHWIARTRAYDLYQADLREAERARSLRLMENKHSKAANVLFDRCLSYIDKRLENFPAREIVRILEVAIRLERMSIGVDPDGKVANNTTTVINNMPQSFTTTSLPPQDESISRMREVVSILTKSGALNVIDITDSITAVDNTPNDAPNDAPNDTPDNILDNPPDNVVDNVVELRQKVASL